MTAWVWAIPGVMWLWRGALIDLAPDSSVLLATGSDVVSRLGACTSIDNLKTAQFAQRSPMRNMPHRRLHPRSRNSHASLRLAPGGIRAYGRRWYGGQHPFGAKGELRPGLEELADGRRVLRCWDCAISWMSGHRCSRNRRATDLGTHG